MENDEHPSQALNPFREAALQYAQRGWHVFPCRPRDKRPLTPHGFKDATTDPHQIRTWWRQWRHANVGIATGEVSGFVVLDIDTAKGGDTSLAALKTACGALPTTLESATGGGGRHLLFQWPGVPVPNRVGTADTLGEGLDVRGDGGYIVAPPSVHPRGGAYQWCDAAWVAKLVPPAPLPGVWVTLLTRTPEKPTDAPEGGQEVYIREGNRNDTLFRFGASMRHYGASEPDILQALRALNHQRCTPPLPSKELRTIARSACGYPPARVADAPASLLFFGEDAEGAEGAQRAEGADGADGLKTAAPSSVTRSIATQRLSTVFACAVERFVKVGAHPPYYYVVLNGQRYDLGKFPAVVKQLTWQALLSGIRKTYAVPLKSPQWQHCLQLLWVLCEEEDEEESGDAGDTLAWLRAFCATRTRVAVTYTSLEVGTHVLWNAHTCYLLFDAFHAFLHDRLGVALERGALRARLRASGWHTTTLTRRDTPKTQHTRRYWQSPDAWGTLLEDMS